MASGQSSPTARKVVWFLVALLFVFYVDFWFWDQYEPLVFGFMPIGLAYHVGLSIATAIVWMMANKYCWPESVHNADSEIQPDVPDPNA